MILALYDESKRTAILAHIDASTDIGSLVSLIKQASSEHTVAHLAGGTRSSKDMCLAIVEMLKKNNIKIVNADIVRSIGINNAASLAIDARTGTIYSPVSPDQLEKTADMELRIRIAGMQFMKSALARYEGPESAAIKKEKLKSLLREFAHFGSSETRLKQHPEQKYDLEQQVEQAIAALLGTECQVIHMMDSEQIINFSSKKSYEQLEEYAKILASLNLSVIAKKPLILDDGFEAVSAKLICKDSLNTILEKLQPKVKQNLTR